MPVSTDSRYYSVPTYQAVDEDGQTHATVSSLPAPGPPDGPVYNHILTGAETMEYLAWRLLGSSEAWWQIADANPLVFPLDIPTGAAVAIPPRQDVGQVVRNRSF